jgi:hypothetical protein
VRESELKQAAVLSAAIVAEACNAPPQDALAWRRAHCP